MLINYSCDKSGWQLYMSIGNIQKDIRRKLNNHAWILIGWLPIPPKKCRRDVADAIFHRSIDTILQSLKTLNPNGPGIEFYCADRFIPQGFPIIAAWITDYPEYTCLTKLIGELCPMCEIPKKKMGHETNICGQYNPNKHKCNKYPIGVLNHTKKRHQLKKQMSSIILNYEVSIIIYGTIRSAMYIHYGILMNYMYFSLGLLKPFLVTGYHRSCQCVNYKKDSITALFLSLGIQISVALNDFLMKPIPDRGKGRNYGQCCILF
jgi:hypothetical protein